MVTEFQRCLKAMAEADLAASECFVKIMDTPDGARDMAQKLQRYFRAMAGVHLGASGKLGTVMQKVDSASKPLEGLRFEGAYQTFALNFLTVTVKSTIEILASTHRHLLTAIGVDVGALLKQLEETEANTDFDGLSSGAD